MNKTSLQHGKIATLLKALCLLALVATVCVLFPMRAFSEDNNNVAYTESGGVRTYYASVQEAIEAGYTGKTVYMARDWGVTSKIKIPSGKTLTIDMSGHAIRMTKSNTDEAIITMEEGSNLTLQSTTNSTFTYEGYNAESGKKQTCTIQTGGLVTGGDTNYAGGVRMLGSSTLTLDNVAIAGNQGRIVGGLEIKKNCTLDMKNGASIEACSGEHGGVFANGDDATINMDNGKIANNYASGKGGGVYSAASATRIHMTNNAAISGNYAGKSGGGVYFDYSYFGIFSSDKTGMIADNHATGDGDDGHGGGIYAEHCKWHTCEGTLQGINVINNYAQFGGGGVYLNQNWTRVIDCTIRGNQCYGAGRGGGIYLSANNISLESCTITDNFCHGSKEGGGVFVNSMYDVKIIGKTIIENNTRGKDGSKDDLFLQDTPFSSAYITGGVDAGSKIGVRLDESGERRFGKNVTTYSDNTYFVDLEGYEVTHGTDAGGDLWQRKTDNARYSLNVNGTVLGRYKYDETINVNGSTTDSSRAFWYWDPAAATGLVPISSYITDENKYDPFLTFAMPQNDVFVSAVYADAITSGKFSVEKPVPGQDLPTEATFQRTDSGTGPSGEIPELAVTWYEVDASGNKTPASGKAKYDTTYVAEFSIQKLRYNGVAFSTSITNKDINVAMSGDSQSSSSATVSESTGTLTVTSWKYTTPKPAVKAIAKTYMIAPVGTSARELEKSLPSKATVHLEDGSSVVVDTDTSWQINWPDGLFDSSGHVKNPEGSTVLLNMELPLKENSAVPGIEKQTVTVEITVNSAGVVGTPQLSPAGGVSTYNKYSGETRLDDNLVLTVNASCITTGASVKYKVKAEDGTWGDAQYANNGEIRLQGTANEIVERDIVVWAEKYVGGTKLESQEVSGTYYLDDTINKEITVNCTDTGSYDSTTPWTSSFTVTGDLDLKTTITAPAQDGRIFSHWEWSGAPEGTNLSSSTLTIPKYSQDLNGKITAVYIPCISTIDLGINSPVVHEALGEESSSVKINVGSDKTAYDITSCFKNDAALTWSPLPESDGTAAHNTMYSAFIQWKSETGSAEYALADNVKLLLDGQSVEGATVCQAANENGSFLCVSFPATGGLSAAKVASISAVDLTYEDAYSYQITSEAGRTASWGLPGEVQVEYACGETGIADIEWSTPQTFNKDDLSAQKLTATGTLTFADGVNTDGVAKTVTATINVAAAETVQAPTASVASGTYRQAQSVALECATQGATVRYTTDGTDPTEASPEYTDAIGVTANTTIRARAFRGAMAPSDVAVFDYVIQQPVSVNGQIVGYYTPGQTVNVDGTPTDAKQAFLCWSESETTGLSPFSDYIKDAANVHASFAMPNNAVSLVTQTFERTSDVTLTVEKPVAGQALATSATLAWGDGNTKSVAVQWTDESGAVVATAPYGEKLTLTCTVAQDKDAKLAFNSNIAAENVKVLFAGDQTVLPTQSASVNSLGSLVLSAGTVETDKATIESVAGASIDVAAGTTAQSLIASLPANAVATLTDGSTAILNTNTTASLDWPAGLLNGSVVADPTSDDTKYTLELPLVASSEVPNVGDNTLAVTIHVLEKNEVASPVLTPICATYSKYGDLYKLTADLKLTVKAACSTEEAVIKYQLLRDDSTWGDVCIYDDSAGIELAGEQNDQKIVSLKVWAEKTIGGKLVQSDSEEAIYVLDDTLNKEITVNCADTALYDAGSTPWSSSFTVTGDLRATVTITAPAQPGRTFSHWEWASAPAGCDLSQPTLTLEDFSLEMSNQIKAVYTPAIACIDLGIDLPKAHEALAGNARHVKVGIANPAQDAARTEELTAAETSGGENVTYADVTKYFAGNAHVEWSPAAESDGTAGHTTAYTATLVMDGDLPEDVAYDITETVPVLVNDGQTSVEGHIEIDADETRLVVTFPATDAGVYSSIADVADATVSHSAACHYQEAQDAGDFVNWGLPDQVEVTYVCGETGTASIDWGEASAFDAADFDAQQLSITGTLTYPEGVDVSKAPTTITARINVSAAVSVAVPTATPAPGKYSQEQSVELSCATEGATIRYTLNGEDPTESSAEYTGEPLIISETTTLRVRAYVNGLKPSSVAQFTYTIGADDDKTYSVTFDSAGGSAVASATVHEGDTLMRPEDPVREGYTFVCWELDGVEYDFSTPVTRDITLVAKWQSAAGGADGDSSGSAGTTLPATGDDAQMLFAVATLVGLLGAGALFAGIALRRRARQ